MECIDQKNLLSACQVSLQAMNPSVMKGDIDVGMYLESTLSSSDIVIGNAYPVPNAYISNQLQGDSYDLYGSDKLDPFELGDTSRVKIFKAESILQETTLPDKQKHPMALSGTSFSHHKRDCNYADQV